MYIQVTVKMNVWLLLNDWMFRNKIIFLLPAIILPKALDKLSIWYNALKKKFEDTKGEIRCYRSKKDIYSVDLSYPYCNNFSP